MGDITVTDQRFGASVAGGTPNGMDGVLGVSYAKSAQTDKITILDRMYEQKQIKQRVFCVRLKKESDGASEVILGGCDVEADKWIPVASEGYWKGNMTKIVVASPKDGSQLHSIDVNALTVFDTGSGSIFSKETQF